MHQHPRAQVTTSRLELDENFTIFQVASHSKTFGNFPSFVYHKKPMPSHEKVRRFPPLFL